MARVKFLTILWISGLLHGSLVLHGVTLPLCWGAEMENGVVFSLAVNNERLDDVLEKISKVSGYEITVNEGWRSKTVSARLENVTLEEGLKVIMEELGRPNHLLIYDRGRKRIEIVLLTASPSKSESTTKVELPASLSRQKQIVPPTPERSKSVARPSLRRIRERSLRPPVPPEKTSDRAVPEEEADLVTDRKGPPDTETEAGEPPGEEPDSTERDEMTPETRSETKAIPQTRRRPVEAPEEKRDSSRP
jgi:hypothetical protein